jgi:hypothetical protein
MTKEDPPPRRTPLCCNDYKCRRVKPMLVRRSEMTGTWYVITDYKRLGNGIISSITRHEITDDFSAYLEHLGWTPPPELPSDAVQVVSDPDTPDPDHSGASGARLSDLLGSDQYSVDRQA